MQEINSHQRQIISAAMESSTSVMYRSNRFIEIFMIVIIMPIILIHIEFLAAARNLFNEANFPVTTSTNITWLWLSIS